MTNYWLALVTLYDDMADTEAVSAAGGGDNAHVPDTDPKGDGPRLG